MESYATKDPVISKAQSFLVESNCAACPSTFEIPISGLLEALSASLHCQDLEEQGPPPGNTARNP